MRLVILSLLLSACAHHAATPSSGASPGATLGAASGASVEHTQGRAPKEAPALYTQAVDELETQKYAEALKDFDRFTQQNQASTYSQAALLNSGRALEGLKNWNEAALRYRDVVAGTARAPRLQAMALYRLSYVHEALADDPQVIADLSDLQSRKRALPQEIAEGEMPARLAAAYARNGSFAKAQQYYKQAEVGIARLRQGAAKTPEWLPKTLFLMGETSRATLSWQDFETFLRPLARSQVYLLQAAELSAEPWSSRATEDLGNIYDELLTTLEKAPMPSGDPLLAKRALQRKQWERAGLMIECLNDLKARIVPETANVAAVKSISATLKKTNDRLNALLSERPAGEELTPSAIARRKARELRTETTSDSLEQAFLRSGRDQTPVEVPTVTQPSPTPAEAPHKEDPNL